MSRTIVWIAILGAMLLVCSAGLVYSRYHSRELTAQLHDLQRQQYVLELQWRQLRLEQSYLAALPEIDQQARQQLDMFSPHPVHDVVYVQR